MNKKALDMFKNLLLEERNRITKLISQDSNVIVDMDGDEIDEIQGNIIATVQSQLSSREKSKILKIDSALLKIKEKTFGKCEDCGEEIPEKRLSFNPYSSTCVGCAEDREIESKKRK